jgi:hypothetical protein
MARFVILFNVTNPPGTIPFIIPIFADVEHPLTKPTCSPSTDPREMVLTKTNRKIGTKFSNTHASSRNQNAVNVRMEFSSTQYMPESGKSRKIVLKAFLVQTLSTLAEIPASVTECHVHGVLAYPWPTFTMSLSGHEQGQGFYLTGMSAERYA